MNWVRGDNWFALVGSEREESGDAERFGVWHSRAGRGTSLRPAMKTASHLTFLLHGVSVDFSSNPISQLTVCILWYSFLYFNSVQSETIFQRIWKHTLKQRELKHNVSSNVMWKGDRNHIIYIFQMTTIFFSIDCISLEVTIVEGCR